MNHTKKQQQKIVFVLSTVLAALVCTIIVGILLFMTVTMTYEYSQSEVFESPAAENYFVAPPSPFLGEEEMIIVDTTASSTEMLPVEKVLFEYVEVMQGCGPYFEGECLNVRSGPGVDYPVIAQLRNSIVLKVGGKVERDGQTWFQIVFDEWLRYPERVTDDWYVAADFVRVLFDEGDKTAWEDGSGSSTAKQIIVDRGKQMLYAYDGDELFLETEISTGLALTPTPRGTFTIFKKTPSRYMQGPLPGLPSDQYYDMPGVPWNLYFTHGGAVVHGTYWHDSFGTAYSHGCVNVPPNAARTLYEWATLGTTVVVRD